MQDKLEQHFHDMQDMEFTVERGTLYMLQTRTGKRTAAAAVRIAGEMVREKLITTKEAVLRVQPMQLDQLLHPVIDPCGARRSGGRGVAREPRRRERPGGVRSPMWPSSARR